MSYCFIILAAGKSKRFNSEKPKQFHLYKGKPLLMHSIDKVKKYKKFSKILLVINKKHKEFVKRLNIKNVEIILGGKTRAESSFKALTKIKKTNIRKVMIHDAARPNFSTKLLNKLFTQSKHNDCVVPAIKSVDAVKEKMSKAFRNLKRENIYLAQTPQAFNFNKLYELQKNRDLDILDDASLFIAEKRKIKIIKGEVNNKKITINKDLKIANTVKYGLGFDVHKLVPNKTLYLGGIKIPLSLIHI